MRPYPQVQPLWVQVFLGTMSMKRHSTFPKAPELEPHLSDGLESCPGYLMGVGWFLWHINPCGSYNAKSCLFTFIYDL